MTDFSTLRDPLQGYDLKVSVINLKGKQESTRLFGAFNSFMWRIVNQTEAYIQLNQRIPRMLDGEIIVVWSLDQGLVNPNVIENTFGKEFADAFKGGRNNVIPRQHRFHIKVDAGAGSTIANEKLELDEGDFNVAPNGMYAMSLQLNYARCDTLTFGVAPGKTVAANSWQGTAEGISEGGSTTAEPPAKK
jgi:hypothetical protein